MVPRGTIAGIVRRAALVLVLGALAAPSRADDAVARSLLDTGKDAFAKKKYDEAIRVLERARIEAPAIAEPSYWIGASREKLGETAAAVAAYRAFRSVASAIPASARGKVDADLLKKTQARLLALAPGEAEDDKLRAQFASEMTSLAKAGSSKEPAAGALALAALLRAEPERDDVRDLLDAATASLLEKGQTRVPSALRKLETWRDLITSDAFGLVRHWKLEPPGIIADTVGREIMQAPIPIVLGTSFAVDMEIRVPAAHSATWDIGFALVVTKTDIVSVYFGEKKLRISSGPMSGGAKPLSDVELGKFDPAEWHRLSVLVRGNRMQVWLDGRRPVQLSVDGIGPTTHLALYHAHCRAELRTFRWAPVP